MSAVLPPRSEEFAFLGLGSNEGDRLTHLQAAVDLLHLEPRVRVDAVSGVYETDPVGGPEQGPYLNMAVRVATTLSPRSLLRRCAVIEDRLGRVRTVRWGPRTIDIDILLYGRRVVETRRLQIPHPRLAERPFALVPTIEVGPGMTWPDGRSLTSSLAALAPVEGVRQIGTQVSHPGERETRR